MKQFSKDLGNVSLAPKGKWSREQEYEKLALVYNACDNLSYVAKINVPSGVDIENREYWQPMNATGYADNNFINLTAENENGTITAYETLEEAVATILPINRRAGATLSFYNLNSDKLDRKAEFELWQFNSTDLANWENKDYWNNIYYNWNVFVGWYIGADALKNHVKLPTVGQYAYVGSNLNDAVLYQCRTNGTWTNTNIKVRNYISVIVSGNITIGDNGNWFSDGKDTGIPATPNVDEQIDNIINELSNLRKMFENQTVINNELDRKILGNSVKIIKTNDRIDEVNKRNDTFASNLEKLNDSVYPITLEFNVSPNVGTMKTSINYSIASDGKALVPDAMKISKQKNDDSAITLLNKPASSGTLTTNIEASREIFKFEVSKTGRTGKSTSTTRYLCYSGGNPADTITKDVINALNKHSTTGVNFDPTVVTKNNDYIWLVVPKYLNIKTVKSAGFDVIMSSVQTIETDFGTYKAYRTVNTLTAQSWKLVISDK